MKKQDKVEQAYNGKYVNYKGKLHQLVPGVDKTMCQGCALEKVLNCPDELTKLCTQGYILKKVNV